MIPWHHLIRSHLAAQAIMDPQPPAAPVVPHEWVPRGDQRLPESVVDRLALLIHERHHGSHIPLNHTKAECARLSGAYDDIFAIEPAILELIREAS